MPRIRMDSMMQWTGWMMIIVILVSCRTQNLFVTGSQVKGKGVADSGFVSTNLHYEYIIRKDDKVSVSVWDNDEASVGSVYGIYNSNEVYGKWLMVDIRGEVNVPRIGALKVQGLTVIQAEDTLRSLYSFWIKHPIVEVRVLNKEVVVMGEVKAAGKFLLEKDNNTLLDLLAKAGDFDFYADKRKVHIIRVEDGQVKEASIDLTRMDHYLARNIRIIPGDVIYVPAKGGKDLDKRFSTILPLISIITAIAIIYKTF